MTREAYHKALKELQDEVLKMSSMVGTAIKESMEALKSRDLEMSRRIVKNDMLINRMRFDIEEKCIRLIATQQPMAVDLRVLASIINVITDLERIGDHAEGIAKISVSIGDEPLVKPLIDMPVMAGKALSMLQRCMAAFVARDAEAAKKICNEDDEVDLLYDTIYNELVLLMVQDPKIIKDATYLIWAAHNIERMADRVTNIAERVVYMATGKMEEMNVSKY
ncbi:MAG: phosphate transport system regulatory protein PhoU [Deltaproteobacteria bacterium GWC2_56_8]|nr:MAG: phosphate transport system regulatory protein PhoU [Deltaproteobacteria bacterium GWB2_55_19]OGP36357.1 MAG: phosphate transport system regulatory protein PhoU [Deltaproteobacteria bacterium GWC2_56_8]HAO93119.1 phosphate transport system regulatory protein PhoU [Deltaproteobacteria bacterium]